MIFFSAKLIINFTKKNNYKLLTKLRIRIKIVLSKKDKLNQNYELDVTNVQFLVRNSRNCLLMAKTQALQHLDYSKKLDKWVSKYTVSNDTIKLGGN